MAEHAGGHFSCIQLKTGRQRHYQQYACSRSRHELAAAGRASPQQHKTERDVDQAAGQQGTFESEGRQSDMHREQHADDRADCICGVHPADRAFTRTTAKECTGDQRQRHSGTECRRQHDQRRNHLAAEIEQHVAGIRPRQPTHQPGHQFKAGVIDQQGRDCEQAHDDLYPAEQALGVGRGVDVAAHREAPKRQTQNEGREHQFERVGR